MFALFLVVFSGYAFWESHEISGFKGLTTGGVMPMLASGVMLVTSVVILGSALRKLPLANGGVFALIGYLFPLRIVLFTILVTVYVAAIPHVGFLAASGGFLFIAIRALWHKGPLWSIAISIVSIGVIHLLFRIVFQVVLPMGSLWR